MSAPDPFVLLGVPADASLADVRAARRRLAMAAHPDHGGDTARMREINAAFDAAVKAVRSRRAGPANRGPVAPATAPTSPARPTPRRRAGAPPGGRVRIVERDEASFVVEARTDEAYRALRRAAAALGTGLGGEPASWLEAHLFDPAECWCRLELLPEGAATMVAVTVGHVEGTPWPPPSVDDVRDAWIGALAHLEA